MTTQIETTIQYEESLPLLSSLQATKTHLAYASRETDAAYGCTVQERPISTLMRENSLAPVVGHYRK